MTYAWNRFGQFSLAYVNGVKTPDADTLTYADGPVPVIPVGPVQLLEYHGSMVISTRIFQRGMGRGSGQCGAGRRKYLAAPDGILSERDSLYLSDTVAFRQPDVGYLAVFLAGRDQRLGNL